MMHIYGQKLLMDRQGFQMELMSDGQKEDETRLFCYRTNRGLIDAQHQESDQYAKCGQLDLGQLLQSYNLIGAFIVGL